MHYTLQSDVSKAFSYLNSPTPPAGENLISPPSLPRYPPITSSTFISDISALFCPVLLSSPLTFTSFYQCPPFSFPPLNCLFLSEMFSSLSLSHYFLFAYLPCVLSLLHCLFLSVSLFPDGDLEGFPSAVCSDAKHSLLFPLSVFLTQPNLPAWDTVMPPLMFQLLKMQEYNGNMIHYI